LRVFASVCLEVDGHCKLRLQWRRAHAHRSRMHTRSPCVCMCMSIAMAGGVERALEMAHLHSCCRECRVPTRAQEREVGLMFLMFDAETHTVTQTQLFVVIVSARVVQGGCGTGLALCGNCLLGCIHGVARLHLKLFSSRAAMNKVSSLSCLHTQHTRTHAHDFHFNILLWATHRHTSTHHTHRHVSSFSPASSRRSVWYPCVVAVLASQLTSPPFV
jgi:hypothetical protein